MDLGNEEWKDFVCAEAGQIGKPVTLTPGGVWSAKQTLSRL